MPINSTHPEYNEHLDAIKRTQDALEGEVQEYVPRKTSLNQQQNDIFRGRASYYNVVERTTMALVGALTRKPCTVQGVYGGEPVISKGDSIEQMIQTCYADLLTSGRVGILCDYDEVNGTPYLVQYCSEHIINWCEDYIILEECFYGKDEKDPYVITEISRYRELYLDENGLYGVRIWEPMPGGKQFQVVEQYEPMVRGQRLTYIPFVCVTPYDVSTNICNPPLFTLANINIEHFVLSASLAHVAWVLASPTPVLVGELQDDTSTIGLGGDKFIHMRTGGSASFLEFKGQGTTFLLDMLKQKEAQMFSLGSRLLQFKAGVESSDALQIRLGAEGASLTTMANALQEGLTKILEIYNSWWMVTEGELLVELNKDFTPALMSPEEIKTLLALFQNNVITIDTLLQRLYEGEIVDDPIEEATQLGMDTTEMVADQQMQMDPNNPNVPENSSMESEAGSGT